LVPNNSGIARGSRTAVPERLDVLVLKIPPIWTGVAQGDQELFVTVVKCLDHVHGKQHRLSLPSVIEAQVMVLEDKHLSEGVEHK
jgi:hypothetical protein